MKLEITRFRCFDNHIVEIPDDEIVLLSGNSGKGKTTLLEAIRWCLYGGTKHVYPFGKPSKAKNPTRVKIITSSYTVERSQPPENLIFTTSDGKKFIEESAQEIINSMYGSPGIFSITSYIPQGSMNVLFSLSQAQKMEVLEEIVFEKGDNPDLYITRLDEKNKDLQRELSSVTREVELIQSKQELLEKYLSEVCQDIDEEKMEKCEELFKETQQLISRISSDLSKQIEEDKILSLPFSDVNPESSREEFTEKLKRLVSEDEKNKAAISRKKVIETLIQKYSNDIDESVPPWDFLKKCERYLKLRHLTNDFVPFDDVEAEHFSENSKELTLYIEGNVPHFEEKYLKVDTSSFSDIRKYLLLCSEQAVSSISKEQINDKEKELSFRKNQLRQYKKFLECSISSEQYHTYIENVELQEKRKTKKELKKQLKKQLETLSEINQSLQQIYDEYSSFSQKYNLPPISEINSLSSARIYECPNCKIHLVINNEVLERCPYSFGENEKKKLLKILDSYTRLTKEKEKIKISDIPDIPGEPLSEKEYRFQLDAVRKIEPYKEVISLRMDVHKEEKETEEMEKEINCYYRNQERQRLEKTIPFSEEECKNLVAHFSEKSFQQSKEKFLRKPNLPFSFDRAKEILDRVKQIPTLTMYRELKTIENEDISKKFNLNDYNEERIRECFIRQDRHLKAKKEIGKLTKELHSLKIGDDLSKEIQECREQLVNYDKSSELYGNFLKRESILSLRQKEGRTLSTSQLMEKIDELHKELNLLHEYLPIFKSLTEHSSNEEKLDSLNKKIKSIRTKIENVNELKSLIIEARSTKMFEFIRTVNSLTNSFLQSVFDDHISIELKLYRENKSNSNVRPIVNFNIYYRGNIYDSHLYLSGGERDRLSLALTVAFSLAGKSQLLILDECLSSLDENARELCIKTLKRMASNKTILNVCHSVIEASHDSIILV